MKRSMRVTALLLVCTAVAFSQGNVWKLDKFHSSVIFTVKHMVISEVVGRFKDFDISVTASKDDFTDAVIDGVIRVNSIDTDNERRDTHLKSDDFFNAEKFREIKFKSALFEKVAENAYKVRGDLTIRDITKPVMFDALLTGKILTKQGVRTGWKVTLSVNRFDYGLKWNSILESGGLIAGETINVTLNFELSKQPT